MNNDSVFRYSYSAKQNEEVQAIRNKYLPQHESKLDELKRLDQCVHSAGMAYLYDNSILVSEIKTDKIGLEEYYIDLMKEGR